MVNDGLLSLQVFFMFILHFSLMFFLSLSSQLLLLFEILWLIRLFVMFNMFGVLFVLLFEISVDFFSKQSHVLLHSLLYFLVDQEWHSISQVVRNLIELILIWTFLVVGLLFQLVQFFLWGWLNNRSLNEFWRLVRYWFNLWWWGHDDRLLNVLLLLLLYLGQLSFSLLNLGLCLTDVVILSIQIVIQFLMVDNMLGPVHEICGTLRLSFSSVVLSFDRINLSISFFEGLFRDSLLWAEIVKLFSDSFWIVFGTHLCKHIFWFLPALVNWLAIIIQSLDDS